MTRSKFNFTGDVDRAYQPILAISKFEYEMLKALPFVQPQDSRQDSLEVLKHANSQHIVAHKRDDGSFWVIKTMYFALLDLIRMDEQMKHGGLISEYQTKNDH